MTLQSTMQATKPEMTTAEAITKQMIGTHQVSQAPLILDVGRCRIRVLTNSAALCQRLRDYFAHIVVPETHTEADVEVMAIERNAVNLDLPFTDWKREAGKSGRKDAVYTLDGARVIHKVRTGMVFLQSMTQRVAAGPCLANDNQVINFINNQYMNWLQQRGWEICHAAAVVKDHRAYAVAGFSGGGKSTLMLQMLEESRTQFLSNDRLFVHAEQGSVQAVGVPKMPRINPGTIINNPRLAHMIPLSERETLQAMPPQVLWDLEQKYDVDITQSYGPSRIVTEAPLQSCLVLNWQRESSEPLRMRKIDLSARPDLLAAIMKSAGPFYQRADGSFSQDSDALNPDAYLAALSSVDVFEATGQVDFARLASHYLAQVEI